MKRYLLDTNAALISLSEPDRLPDPVRTAILSGPNLLTVVSYWEVVIKNAKGTLKVGTPDAWWQDALDQLAANPLSFRPEHVAKLYGLPVIHKDPFDRILIAQAIAEGLELVTIDREVSRYAGARLRIFHYF